jgi:hypothetical protein
MRWEVLGLASLAVLARDFILFNLSVVAVEEVPDAFLTLMFDGIGAYIVGRV